VIPMDLALLGGAAAPDRATEVGTTGVCSGGEHRGVNSAANRDHAALHRMVWRDEEGPRGPYPAGDAQNARPAVKRVRATRDGRVTPLAVAAVLDALVFAPPTFGLVANSVSLFVARDGHYDAVVASLILIWLFTAVLARRGAH
jgi:hypothetical protein